MKAALLYGPRDMRIEEVEKPTEDIDRVLIKIKLCGICPSDIRFYGGIREPVGRFPCILGHEWAGEIVKVGKEVKGFKEGDRVVPDWRVICGKCYYCRKGMFSCCPNLDFTKIKGGFSEYGSAVSSNLHLIRENISYKEAVFAEPLACCINGIIKSNIHPGDDVVIIGAGPIGLMHIQLAKHCGARVIVSEIIEERLEVAKKLGADDTVNPARENLIKKVKELTEGRGADAVIMAVGIPNLVEQAITIAGIGSVVNIFAGIYPPTKIEFDFNLVHYKQLVIIGSHDFTPHHFSSALKLIEHRIVKVELLISHILPLKKIEEAFNVVTEKRGLKSIIKCSG